MTAKRKSPAAKVLKAVLIALILVVVCAGAYVAYVFASWHRIPDMQALEVTGGADAALEPESEYSIVTWNLGFGAYSDDYSFFMDGGTESWAFSRDAVHENIGAAIASLRAMQPDLMILQELDFDATRSYHVDERALVQEAFPEMDAAFAVNYDSPFLMYPLTQPHGASRAGILTLSGADIASSVRRSLPIETGLMKVVDLDRCYSVSHIPVSNGRDLALVDLHLSAYTSDGTIATEQLKMLIDDLSAEYENGNYVIAGGDFNKDLLGNSPEVFGVSGEKYTWAQPIDESLLTDGLTLVKALDEANPVPSCRNCDIGYIEGTTFVVTVDGFIVSDNVEVLEAHVVDEGFKHSDHNPVRMAFRLKG